MRIFICADMEGVGGVARQEHTRPGEREYERARIWMTREVNAAAEACFDANATSVTVADSHNVGLNLIPDMLHPRVRLVIGAPRPLGMMEGVQQGTDLVFFLGAHAMAGTPDACICHTYIQRVRRIRLNSVQVGEIGINAALAGYFETPVALVAGDAAACAEAENLLPGVETVALKQAVGAYSVKTHTPEKCQDLIRQAVKAALSRVSPPPIWRMEGHVMVEVEFTTSSGADQAMGVPGTERGEDGCTVRYEAPDTLIAHQALMTMVELSDTVTFI